MYKKILTSSALIASTTIALGSLHAAPVVYTSDAQDLIRSETQDTHSAEHGTSELAEVELEHTPIERVRQKEDDTQEAPAPIATNPTAQGNTSVPFFSQFADISATEWRKVGCGIASLAMLIEYYEPGSVDVNTLLAEGIKAKAFLADAGWTHAGLIGLAKKYGLTGASHDLSGSSMSSAFSELERVVAEGPVMVSVHYTFDPKNPIPHLVVINEVRDGVVYYNDPAEPLGNGTITADTFKKAWKKRYISIRPVS